MAPPLKIGVLAVLLCGLSTVCCVSTKQDVTKCSDLDNYAADSSMCMLETDCDITLLEQSDSEEGDSIQCGDTTFVPEGSVCFSTFDEALRTCLHGKWTETGQGHQMHRFKRWLNALTHVLTGIHNIICIFFCGRHRTRTVTVTVPNKPPEIQCPASQVLTAEKGTEQANASWTTPNATDPEGGDVSVRLDSDKNPDSYFDVGRTEIYYKAVDSGSATSYCHFSITVKVSQCQPKPEFIEHGSKSCSTPRENIYGTVCNFECKSGYQLTGDDSSVECQQNGSWTGAFPTCQPVSCGPPGNVQNGSLLCPIGHSYPAFCIVNCGSGYQHPAGGFTQCTAQGMWLPAIESCKDVEAPKFTNDCPADQDLFSGPLRQPVSVTWVDPVVTDNSGQTVTLTSDLAKGTAIGPGSKIIHIHATDTAGNVNTCSFGVTVTARTCQPPMTPSNGNMKCSHGYVEGSACSVTCAEGYDLKGNATLTCSSTEEWDNAEPQCEGVMCPSSPPQVEFGHFDCAYGYQYRSVCILQCDPTFQLKGLANIQCQKNATWSSPGYCEDIEPPTFPNGCPANVEVSESRLGMPTRANWSAPDVTDNTGQNVDLQCSHQSGSQFTSGVTTVTYLATDVTGLSRSCHFTITVTTLTCPSPMNNPYSDNMLFNCSDGIVYGAVCTVGCSNGFPLTGSKNITCENDGSFPPVMGWTFSNAVQPECVRTNCSVLTAPEHGALACYQGNFAKECRLSCGEHRDVPAGTSGLYECPNTDGIWHPTDEVPGCSVRIRPGQVGLNMDIYYFTGSCQLALDDIRQNFMDRLAASKYRDACAATPTCAAQNIEVTCGANSRKRRDANPVRVLRQTQSHRVRISFDIMVDTGQDGGSASPQQLYRDVKADMQRIYEKLVSASDSGLLNIGTLVTDENSVGYPAIKVQCPVGTIFLPKPTTNSFSCVGCGKGYALPANASSCSACSKGSYSDTDNATACTACPSGSSTPNTASTSSSDCKEVCSAGYYSVDGFMPCQPCPPGHFQTRDEATTCDLCPANTWTTGQAADQEECVPADAYLTTGSSLTAQLTGHLTAFTLRSFLYLDDDSLLVFTLDFNDTRINPLTVGMDTHTGASSVNSTFSASHKLESEEWKPLSVTMDTSSGNIDVLFNNASIFTTSITPIINAQRIQLTVRVVKGFAIVSGLYASQTPVALQDSLSCNGDVTTNALTWTVSPALVHIPSGCDAVDECESAPCSGSHGKCINLLNEFRCECFEGWGGADCQTPPDACYHNQCWNGGTCAADPGGQYKCVCDHGFSGQYCNFTKVNGGFGEWSSWSNCSASCEGLEHRQRLCNNPPPANDGDDCVGDYHQTQACGLTHCPVSGNWTVWSSWSSCSATCGGGEKTRHRQCTNPAPQYGGHDCDGLDVEFQMCNTHQCPVNGGWSDWSVWTPCSASCEGGIRSRGRSCDSPVPAYGGAQCQGDVNQTQACNEQQCPVCSRLIRVHGTIMTCETNDTSGLKVCNVTCEAGYGAAMPVPQYMCGPTTNFLWNGQTEQGGFFRPVECSQLSVATGASLVQEVTMMGGCDVNPRALSAGVERNMAALPCMQFGCTATASTRCVSNGRKRSVGSAQVSFKLEVDFWKGVSESMNETEVVDHLRRSIEAADLSAGMAIQNDTERLFTVTVDDVVIVPDASSVTFTSGINCPPGQTSRSFTCLDCPVGTKEVKGQCEFCPVGQYQKDPGMTSCKDCPDGLAWDLPGAKDIAQCIYPFDDPKVTTQFPEMNEKDVSDDNNVPVIVGGVLGAVGIAAVVAVIAALIFFKVVRKPRKERPWSVGSHKRPWSAGSDKVWPLEDTAHPATSARPMSVLSSANVFVRSQTEHGETSALANNQRESLFSASQ